MTLIFLSVAPVEVPPAELPAASAPPCAPDVAVAGVDPAVRENIVRLEAEAEAADGRGDHLRVAFLLLQAERHLPLCAAPARADRVDRAISALRRAQQAGTDAARLDTASAVVAAFLADMEVAHGALADTVDAIVQMRRTLVELQEAARQAHAAELAATRPRPLPVLTPVRDPGPTAAEREAHARRTRGLAVGVGVGVALTLAAAGTALGTRLMVVRDGPLHRDIQRAAAAVNADTDPNNDVANSPGDDLCLQSRTTGADDSELARLCDKHGTLLATSTAMWVTAGALGVATTALATLLAVHRRGPVARALDRRSVRVLGGPVPGGVAAGVSLKF